MDRQQWDERYSGAEFEWSMHPNQFAAEQLDGLPPGRALDLAAGEGRNSVWLAERGWAVTAVAETRGTRNCGAGPGLGPTAKVKAPCTGWPSTEIARQ